MDKSTDRSEALAEIMKHRHSCRGFTPDQVPTPILEKLVAMTQASPSWCNVQPWELVITRGKATERLREELAKRLEAWPEPDIAWPPGYVGVYQERRRACARALYESVGVEWGDRSASKVQMEKNFSFFGAPHVAILTTPASLGVYGAVDVGVYLGNLLLAMDSLGLGSIAQAAVALHSPFLHEHFAIPADRQIVCGVSFGYSDETHPANSFRTERADPKDVVRFFDE